MPGSAGQLVADSREEEIDTVEIKNRGGNNGQTPYDRAQEEQPFNRTFHLDIVLAGGRPHV
jgi:hypothetical protein